MGSPTHVHTNTHTHPFIASSVGLPLGTMHQTSYPTTRAALTPGRPLGFQVFGLPSEILQESSYRTEWKPRWTGAGYGDWQGSPPPFRNKASAAQPMHPFPHLLHCYKTYGPLLQPTLSLRQSNCRGASPHILYPGLHGSSLSTPTPKTAEILAESWGWGWGGKAKPF